MLAVIITVTVPFQYSFHSSFNLPYRTQYSDRYPMNYMFRLKGAMLRSSVNTIFLETYKFLAMAVHQQYQEHSQGLFPLSQYYKTLRFGSTFFVSEDGGS